MNASVSHIHDAHVGSNRAAPDDAALLGRMQAHVRQWKTSGDARAIFLECYLVMTRNMVAGLHGTAFGDPRWVHVLLHRFAGYYFQALDGYETDGTAPPPVWQVAFDHAARNDVQPVQHLLLGVNAHINYDLVLTLDEILAPEWPRLAEKTRALRYADHCGVNRVIAKSVDAVQDAVIGPRMPLMRLIDAVFGPVDEYLASRLIEDWREDVWQHVRRLLACRTPSERADVLQAVEDEAMQVARRLEAF